MLDEQTENTLNYKIATSLLNRLFEDGIITAEQKIEIDKLNQVSYNPKLAKIYGTYVDCRK